MSGKTLLAPESKLSGISEKFIEEICRRLTENKRVRRTLPVWGRLHIDRQLPFLCVYRRPVGIIDEGTDRLIMGEASYLLASGQRKLHKSVSDLVQQIASVLAAEFGTFLIFEIWAGSASEADTLTTPHRALPHFRIHTPVNFSLYSTSDRLQRSLRNVKIMKQPVEVETVYNSQPHPPKQLTLNIPNEANENKIHYFGLEIMPVYRDVATGQVFPLVLRALHRSLARALKQTFYKFARTEATHFPKHYQALGRRAMVRAVWRIDEQLAQISNAFDFLLFATPTNADEAWNKFRRSNFEKPPTFFYRSLPYEPAKLKRELYQIRIERVEDPTLEQIFREKQKELDRKISMLAERGGRNFLYGGMQLFGAVDKSLWRLAQELLEEIPPRSREDSKGGVLNADSFARCAREEIEYYRHRYPSFTPEVEIRRDITGLLVSRGKLLIGSQSRVPASRVDALLQHEVGTHLLTYYNGQAQPFKQLYSGLTGYDELQEGLAVLSEYLVGGLSRPRLRLLAARVVAVKRLIEGKTFVETFRELDRHYDFEQRTAYNVTMRVYRGGGLTKDAVYLRGLVHLLEYLKNGGELAPLFVGKISAAHVPIISELLWRKILLPPPLKPRYMENPQAQERLKALEKMTSLLDLLKRR
jgi:uncharacterized protein (TIGR02421 family)